MSPRCGWWRENYLRRCYHSFAAMRLVNSPAAVVTSGYGCGSCPEWGCGVFKGAAPAARLASLSSLTVGSSFRCAPLRMTCIVRRIEEKEKRVGAADPFLLLPMRISLVILNAAKRSEGSRGYTSAVTKPRDYIPNHLLHHKSRKQPKIFPNKAGGFVRDVIPAAITPCVPCENPCGPCGSFQARDCIPNYLLHHKNQ
jgi:hypothetical protein